MYRSSAMCLFVPVLTEPSLPIDLFGNESDLFDW